LKSKILKNLIEIIAGIFFTVMCASVIIGVFDRFIMGMGLPWPEELARFLFIWASLLSAVAVTKKKHHYMVDFFTKRLFVSEKGKHLLQISVNVICCAVLVIIVYKGIELTSVMSGNISPALSIPMGWIFASVPVCGAMMLIFFIIQSVKSVLNRKLKYLKEQ
jgi:TRAP-type C4-dicarboxylate transport system permease small subunit